ncbi:hypothetical protein JCM14635_24900 [Megalodesulfovibrio paquesii]
MYLNKHMVELQGGTAETEQYLDQDISLLLCYSEDAIQLLQECFATKHVYQHHSLLLESLRGLPHTVQAIASPVFGVRNEVLGASLAFVSVPHPFVAPASSSAEECASAWLDCGHKTMVLMAQQDGTLAHTDATLERFLTAAGLTMKDFLPPDHAAWVAQCLHSGQRKTGVRHTVAGKGYSWTYTPLMTLHTVQVSVTELPPAEKPEDRAAEEHMHDPLTGLANRALFMLLLGQALKRAARASQQQFAVLFLDLDRFKLINDSLGHDVGDALLRGVSERILGVLRSIDTLARLSGDEFVILLDSVDDVAGAMHAAERILMALDKPFVIRTHELFVTASIGIVVDNGSYASPEELVRDADTAMFRAKAQGKGSCMVFDKDMHKSARKRLEIEMDLKRTLDRDEFRVFYQPIVSLRTLQLHGLEALVRWFHPVRGMVSPNDFIPLAEETGMIIHIGTSVLYEACRTVSDWQVAFPTRRDLLLSVNLSVRQFNSPTLLDDMQQILAWSEFPPHLLKLEITESGIMENAESSLRLLNALKAMQIRLSIDDFGTGYSSLSYLHRFPFDFLKVDQSFIRLMHESDENMKIVKTIITLAHDMDKQVIAEGVETVEQLHTLRLLGCEYAQGFLFAKPLSAEHTETLLAGPAEWSHVLEPASTPEETYWEEDA